MFAFNCNDDRQIFKANAKKEVTSWRRGTRRPWWIGQQSISDSGFDYSYSITMVLKFVHQQKETRHTFCSVAYAWQQQHKNAKMVRHYFLVRQIDSIQEGLIVCLFLFLCSSQHFFHPASIIDTFRKSLHIMASFPCCA